MKSQTNIYLFNILLRFHDYYTLQLYNCGFIANAEKCSKRRAIQSCWIHAIKLLSSIKFAWVPNIKTCSQLYHFQFPEYFCEVLKYGWSCYVLFVWIKYLRCTRNCERKNWRAIWKSFLLLQFDFSCTTSVCHFEICDLETLLRIKYIIWYCWMTCR